MAESSVEPPAVLRSGAERDDAALAGPAPVRDSVREDPAILLVDDNPDLLDSLFELVSLHGFRPDKALGGRQALALLDSKPYDVVLLDLIMPEVSGHDLLDHARREGLDAKLIVVSGDASFDGVQHALHCGAFDYVRKPYDPGELIATLELALRQRRLEHDNRRMQSQIRESEALHRFIVNTSPDLVYMLDRNGCFTFLNDRVEPLLGYSREELLGRHFSEIIDPEFQDVARNLFAERRTGRRATTNFEVRLKRRRGAPGLRVVQGLGIWVELTAQGIYEDPRERTRDGFLGTYGTARDISERKEAQEVINFQAYHDLLTHLPNRALLKDRLSLAIAQAERNERRLAVMFLDLDRFKVVNDTLGHTMGDRLLKAVAGRLQGCLRAGDTLSRFGGDEFMLLLPDIRTRDDVVVIANKILQQLHAPFVLDGHELFVGASIGIAMYPEAGSSEEALIQNADIAMYHVKGRSKNGFQFFSEEMNHHLSTRLTLERELRNAIAAGQLEVFYQPQVRLASGSISGVEALVRWKHPERGLLAPEAFLPIALETGLIPQIDEYVQRRALEDLAAWHARGHQALRLSVNLSALQLEQDSFVERLLREIARVGLTPGALKVEITENILMRDMEAVVPKLRRLQAAGMQIAIDDFGTGYSSLSYLRQVPIDTLKVDRSFVADIRADQRGVSIVDAIVAMARGLKLDLIAEGVENRVQLRYLKAQGCSEVQGFIFSPPVDAHALGVLLERDPYRQLVLDGHGN
ncbi:MAG: EAL domain-containing protein [Pseudomonadales bacterium]|nr:EAL domain-containing protein [Pseudomonadales bacterium]